MRKCAVPYLLAVAVLVAMIAGCGGNSPSAPTATRSMQTRSVGGVDYLAILDYYKNPVIPVSSKAFSPFVLAHGGQYYMWTNGVWGGAYMATSPDGIQWSPLTPCTGLATYTKRPTVLYNDQLGKFEVWYWNNGNMFGMDGYEHAVSSDGVNWTGRATCKQYAAPHRPLYTIYGKGIGTYGPSQVFFNPSSTLTTPDYTNPWANRYVMYYDTLREATNTEALAMAVSPDGITWGVATEGGCVLPPGPSGTWDCKSTGFASIFREAGEYHMYYGGANTMAGSGQGIGYATSIDGLTWTKHSEPLIHANDGISWRKAVAGSPSVVVIDGRPRVYFCGRNDGSVAGIGFAMIDTTAPVITLQTPVPEVLWAPKEGNVTVTFAGAFAEDESGLGTVSLQIDDEYGELTQTVDLLPLVDSAGQFQISVPVATACLGGDRDGRLYTITATAVDKAGNAGTPVVVTAVAPHNSTGKPPKK
ncbi:MAG: hypothetical protein ABFE07_02075 [Armatimonadia bacterium]